MKYIYILSTLLFLSGPLAYAQPANDDCSGAQSVTPDGTCVSGTTVAANDSWSGAVGCQSGGSPNSHEEVWYSFTATGTQASIDATATGSWTGNVEIVLVDGTCAGSFSLLGSNCGASPVNLTYTGLTPGTTYYYTISNDGGGTNGTFDVCTNNATPPSTCIDNELCSAPEVLALTSGTQSCLTDCNTGASAGPNFAGSNCEDMLNPTVWYEVTTGASDVTLDITLNSTDFSDPEFVVFQTTDCSSFTIVNCTEGTAGAAAANMTVTPSTTYLIAVSDATADEGNFDLCVTIDGDNSPCNTTSALVVTGTSLGSPLTGPFQAGEVISFCYSITDWQTGASCNYLGGIVPSFGTGWDASSFDGSLMPVSITTPLVTAGQVGNVVPGNDACENAPAGTWSWYIAGVVQYNNILASTGSPGALPDGTNLPGGWFFVTNYDSWEVENNGVWVCPNGNTDPNDNYGDNSFPSCDNTLDWSICFDLTVGPISNCSGGLTDLGVTMQTYADGEIGVWNSVGCVGNIAQVSPAVMSCCLATATVSGGGSYCQGVSPTGINVQIDFTGTGPWTLTYTDGTTPTTLTTSSNPYYIVDATAGTYTVTAIADASCTGTSTGSATVTEIPLDDATFTYSAASYCQDAVDPSATITGTAGGTFSSTAGLTISSGTGLIDVSASTPGTYTITYLTSGLCPVSSTVDVTIVVVDDPSFTYSAASYCQDLADPTPTITGTAGGTFSAGAGLSITTGTGVIDLSASTAGVSTVTYLTGGTCPASTTFGVTVVAVDDPSFTYSAAAYCQDASDPTPTITGTAGGTFSSGAGLSISAGTGLIDVSASTVGSYAVTYLTGGTCPASITFSVDVDAVDDPSFTYAAASYCQNGVDPTPTITGTAGGTFSAGAGLSITAGTGVIDLSASTAGVYTVTYLTGGTCPASTTFGVTVVGVDDPSFTYSAAAYCQDASDPTPTITGTAGGTFSSGAGLSISAGTGLIDVSASTVGSYTVTYLTGGTCPASTTFSIDIDAVDDPSFTYAAASYCQNGVDPTPTITGVAGGTFSAGAGLSITAGTGVIDLSASTSGVYTVTYLTGGTCPASTTFGITIVLADDATFTYAAASYCQNGIDPTPTITGTAGGTFSAGAGLSISAGTGVIDLSASTAGVYTATYLTGGACPASSTFGITITATDDPSYSYSSGTYCLTGTDPIPTVTGLAGGTFTATGGLVINAGTGEVGLVASGMGTYTVTYSTNGSCPTSLDFAINITSSPDATFSYTGTPYCAGTSVATVTYGAGASGGDFTSTAGLVINIGTGEVDLATSTPGTYTVDNNIAAAGGCAAASASTSIEITAADDPTFSYASASYCQDLANPTPTATTGGGIYSSTAGLTINAGTGEIDLATSTAGTYTVTHLTSGTCPASSTFDVTLISVDNPAFSYSPITYCMNGVDATPVITGTPGGAFSSTGGLSINSVSGVVDVSTSTAGPYTVTYLTAGTCPASSTFDITVNAVDDPSFTYSSATYCQNLANQLPTVTGTPGGVYSSTAGLSIVAGTGEIDLASSTPGSYDVTYLTGGACPASTTFSIMITTVDDASFSYSSATYCQDASNPTPTITGTAGGAFSSTVGLTINSVTGTIDVVTSTIGVYSVTYLTTGTCPTSNSVSVEIIGVDDPSFTYSSVTYCQDLANQMPTVTGTTGGTYNSTAGLSIVAGTGEIDLASSTPGSYDVTYLTGGACPSSTTFSITITAVDDPSFTYSSATYCQDGIDPTPTITTVGGAFTATAGLSINGASGVIDLAASTIGGPYTVTYTTGGTCFASTTFDVTVVGVGDPSFTYSSATYCQDLGNQMPTVTGTGGGTYSSTPGLSIVAGTGEIDLAASTPGAYDVTYSTSGTCPASTTFSITITVVDDASFSYSSNAFCVADPNPIATITGTLGGTFTMSGGGLVNASTGEINISGNGAGAYTIYYTTVGTCPAIDSTVITITSQLDATITLSGPYCSDDVMDTLISVTTGGTWSGTGVNAVTGEFDPVLAGAGTHEIVYVLGGSCGSSDTINVVVTQAQQAVMTGIGPYCSGEGSEFITVDTVGGTWSGTGVNSTTGEFDPVTAGVGTWEIIYSPVGTCMNDDTIQVVVSQTPTAGAGVDVTIVSGESTTLTGTGGGAYSWSPSGDLSCNTCFDPVANPLETTTYVVTVSNNGCSDTSSVVVTVTELEDNEFFIPNIFSPNGDGNNDVFIVEGSGLENFNLLVFNRWGEKVFESSDQAAGWDGTQNGERLNAAVFVYQIKYTDGNGEEQVVTGNITLVK